MPRRKGLSASSAVILGVFTLIFAVSTAIGNAIKSIGGGVFIALIVGVIALIIFLKIAAKKRKLEYLTGKYGNPTIVDHILNHRYWQGQTAEQLADSLWSPHGVDRKLLKTIKREVWKYNPRGANRYGLRITLDNDIVNTWDHKQ